MANSKNPVLVSAKFVVRNSRLVKINKKKIKDFVLQNKNKFKKARLRFLKITKNDLKKNLTYLMILQATNFCFWSKNGKFKVKAGKRFYFGSEAYAFLLQKYFRKNLNKLDFDYLQKISFSEFSQIFQSAKVKLPLLKERWLIIKQLSQILVQKYQNDPIKFVLSAKGSALKLLSQIAKLPGFNDECIYKKRKIYFWKKAQLLVASIHYLEPKGIGRLKDLDKLTVFPDYNLAKLLHYYQILTYQPDLESKIKRKFIFPTCAQEIIEIRGNAIFAGELIKKELQKHQIKIESFQLDTILWFWAHKLNGPHFLTKSIFL